MDIRVTTDASRWIGLPNPHRDPGAASLDWRADAVAAVARRSRSWSADHDAWLRQGLALLSDGQGPDELRYVHLLHGAAPLSLVRLQFRPTDEAPEPLAELVRPRIREVTSCDVAPSSTGGLGDGLRAVTRFRDVDGEDVTLVTTAHRVGGWDVRSTWTPGDDVTLVAVAADVDALLAGIEPFPEGTAPPRASPHGPARTAAP